jgi:Leucine-rich repeat (LRR) protein
VGTIPAELGLLLALKDLSLPYNQLEGSLPESLQYLTALDTLNLHDNALTGTLPDMAFKQMSDLKQLSLSANLLSGFLPGGMTAMTRLTLLHLQENGLLTGSLSSILPQMPSLQSINVAQNLFTGTLDQLLFVNNNVVQWQELDLSSNLLQGSVPLVVVMSNTTLTTIYRQDGVANVVPSSLQYLRLANNQFSGNLQNSLGGGVSTTTTEAGGLSLLPSLIALDVSKNQFTGDMPSSLYQSLPQLQLLSLADNPWAPGTIPTELVAPARFRELNLAQTQRTGTISSWLGVQHVALQLLRLDGNYLTGEIPPGLGYISSLNYLLLNNNQLQGTLPESMSNLQQLQILRIDGNRLEGDASSVCGNVDAQQTFHHANLVLFASDCDSYMECSCCTHCTNCDDCQGDTDNLLGSSAWTHSGFH